MTSPKRSVSGSAATTYSRHKCAIASEDPNFETFNTLLRGFCTVDDVNLKQAFPILR